MERTILNSQVVHQLVPVKTFRNHERLMVAMISVMADKEGVYVFDVDGNLLNQTEPVSGTPQ